MLKGTAGEEDEGGKGRVRLSRGWGEMSSEIPFGRQAGQAVKVSEVFRSAVEAI